MSGPARTTPGGRGSLAAALWTLLVALGFCVGAAGVGLAFNALRARSLPLRAPFPYQQDCPEKIDPDAPVVSAEQARGAVRAGRAVLVDARPLEDFDAGHLPGARSLPLSISQPVGPAQVRSLKNLPLVIVYCDSPEDRIAGLQAEQLRHAGLKRVTVLAGGIDAYRQLERQGGQR